MIGNGADVIWHAADVTGLGAIEGAVASGARVLGAYSDQISLAPDNLGASLVMDLAQMVQTKAQEVRDGSFAGGIEWRPSVDEMWHWAAGEGNSYNSAVISEEIWGQFVPIWDELSSGSLDVSALLQ
jgi:basic membrane protein A